jgi:hypothetical protein
MEKNPTAMITATLTKVLHTYGDVLHTETMRFANRESTCRFRDDMLNKRTKGFAGTEYTITAFAL